jgi:hypothetical protein
VRSLELFYKLFLINPAKRESVQLCPFVKNGVMHRKFQKHLRPDGLGIDYSKLTHFDTLSSLEETFSAQRPAGEKMLTDAINRKDLPGLEWAIENAKRIRIDKVSPALFDKALKAKAEMAKKKSFEGQ